MDTLERLAQLANNLDNAGLQSLADTVDSVLGSMTKVAQYVGVQGYWIRNERCWGNCYRQKRASSPNKPAQEIWVECQQEYEASINKDESKWDKYASDDKFVKTASYKSSESKFASEYSNLLSSGLDPATAAFTALRNNRTATQNECLDNVAKMVRVADVLDKAKPALADEATALANELLKQAQSMWNPLNWFKGKGQSTPSSLQGILDQAVKSLTQHHVSLKNLNKQFYASLKGAVQQINDYASQNPNTKALADNALKILNEVSTKPRLSSQELQGYLDKLLQIGAESNGGQAFDQKLQQNRTQNNSYEMPAKPSGNTPIEDVPPAAAAAPAAGPLSGIANESFDDTLPQDAAPAGAAQTPPDLNSEANELEPDIPSIDENPALTGKPDAPATPPPASTVVPPAGAPEAAPATTAVPPTPEPDAGTTNIGQQYGSEPIFNPATGTSEPRTVVMPGENVTVPPAPEVSQSPTLDPTQDPSGLQNYWNLGQGLTPDNPKGPKQPRNRRKPLGTPTASNGTVSMFKLSNRSSKENI